MTFSNFSELRKSRGNGISNLLKEVEKLSANGGNSSDDSTFWQPEVDKVGNGQAIIRFLPSAPDNDYPWVRVFSHGFQNKANGKWFIENCPTTLNQECPVCVANNELWNTGTKENQDIVRTRKRKLHYVANILVIKDSKNPDNEGKVFKFKFGTKIFEKIKNAMQPQFEDETPIDPFDFWEGANFKLKICKVEGYRNYDRSEFDAPSPIADSDKEIEEIWRKEHDLRELIADSQFKQYKDLEKRLQAVLGNTAPVPSAQEQAEAELEQYVEPSRAAPRAPQAQAQKPAVPPRKPIEMPPVGGSDSGEDDDSAYFASLLDDDN